MWSNHVRIVLYNVTSGFKSGGIETYTWEVSRALIRQGHEAILVTGDGPWRMFDDVPVVSVPFTDRGDFRYLKWVSKKTRSMLGKYLERRSFARNALKYVADLRPDCVVIFKPYDFGFMKDVKRLVPGVIIAFRSGGKDFFLTDRLNKHVVDVWISCSTYNQKHIQKRYRTDVTVIPHGVATDVFKTGERDPEFRRRLGISEDSFILVCVGRLVKWKGYQTVVKAISNVESVELLVIGSGGYKASLEDLSAECGVAKRVHFVGEVKNYDIPYYLGHSDVYVHPAHGEEAFGITLLEAMACGLPVIASDKGAIPEVLGGKGGLVIPAADTNAWAGAIRDLMADDVRRRALAEAGYDRVVKRFSWDKCASELVDAIENR